jgi:S-adenosylmethionine:tRNA ribosyltransferase-isomerase
VIAATHATQRPADAKLLVVGADGTITHTARTSLPAFVEAGDVLIANDAATLPASLSGRHDASGEAVEVRLAGWVNGLGDPTRFLAVVFGSGDYHTRTEHRPAPPRITVADRLTLGPLHARVERVCNSRLAIIAFAGTPAQIWSGLAQHGKPIQYAHIDAPLALWDVWTPFAGPPAAFEPPSAGFALDWQMQAALHARGVGIATLTHAAGISTTGDEALDAALPLAEAYYIPAPTIEAIASRRGRVIAVGTTVVRALEHAAAHGLRAGAGTADQRIGSGTRLRIVDMLLTGTHERATSHFDLLRAFASDAALRTASESLDDHGYRTHEFGDSMLVARRQVGRRAENRAEAALAV